MNTSSNSQASVEHRTFLSARRKIPIHGDSDDPSLACEALSATIFPGLRALRLAAGNWRHAAHVMSWQFGAKEAQGPAVASAYRPLSPLLAGRRTAHLASLLLLLLGPVLAGCASHSPWHGANVTGSLPDLQFDLVRASDDKRVSANDYRGKVVLLYFGYTYCPDACPTTLSNLGLVLHRLGRKASGARVLFVSVDPHRDTIPVLRQYAQAFGQQVDALRGDENAVAALARRYRIAYSVSPAAPGHEYQVTHSSAIYVFDQAGAARLLVGSLLENRLDLEDTVEDVGRLVDSAGRAKTGPSNATTKTPPRAPAPPAPRSDEGH